jgi:hypothetical protein
MKMLKSFIGKARFLIMLVVLIFFEVCTVLTLDAMYNSKFDIIYLSFMLFICCLGTMLTINSLLKHLSKFKF